MNELSKLSDPHEDAADEAKNSANRTFRENLNHKLRTPLNAIIGFSELMAMQPAGKRGDQDVQQILKSARELLAIIETELAEPGEKAREKFAVVPSCPDCCDVLYVEDDAINFALVERILEYRPGLKVKHAPRGKIGVEMAEFHQPKMVLLDLNLPDMHGADVLQQLLLNPSTAEIPVVILSANATPSEIERLLTAGAKNYLTKPFDIDPFLAVVDEFAEVKRLETA